MKTVKYLLAIIVFSLFIALCVYINSNYKNKKCNSISSVFLSTSGEIYDKFLVTPEASIVFSINDSNNYSFKIYKNGKIDNLLPNYKDVFNPILVCGEISAIQDSNENEEYKTISTELIKYIGSNSIKEIYSFRNGYLVLLHLQNDNGVYLINLRDKTKRRIIEITQKLNGAAFSEVGNYLIISYDDKLICVDELTSTTIDLANDLEGDKLNPYIFDDYVYFVNNSQSEYYQVFKINLKESTNPQVQPVFQMEHDIRMPKIEGNYLYFIEVINSEYILKRLNFTTRKINEITNQGVVYNYEFYKDGKIAFVYSDIITPRCVMIYNEQDKSFNNISGSSVIHDLSFHFLKSDLGESYAYELKKKDNNVKGVILYIHPGGSHSDFSPRWDAILMNLCNNGYIVVAPNFHMATGYGKTYYNSSIDQALDDVKEWKKFIHKEYSNFPLFCFSISSGNILMEKLISQDNENIKAAVSLFGIPAKNKETNYSVPELYIFGENDPFIDFKSRNSMLRKKKILHPSISIASYPDEGHWFRKKRNLQDAVDKIINHLCLYSN